MKADSLGWLESGCIINGSASIRVIPLLQHNLRATEDSNIVMEYKRSF